jgi:hypothetical protein
VEKVEFFISLYYMSSKSETNIYRWRSCDTNLTSNTPSNRYQILKLIQKTVHVPSSLYTMNLAGLNAYQRPDTTYRVVDVAGTNYLVSPGVNWNQMSDRKEPHKQVVVTSSGSTYRGSSTRRTIVRQRPGAMSPGGSGVDIKHNSYERYLNRIKGRGPFRRGIVPPGMKLPYIPFNPAFPVYGGKLMKTSIVSGCNCPEISDDNDILYKNLYPEYNILDYQSSIAYPGIAKKPCECTDITSGDQFLINSVTGENFCVFPNESFLNSLV